MVVLAARYILEVHNASTGNLIAILDKAYSINYQYAKNEPNQFNFSLPPDDPNRVYLTMPNEVWLKDYETSVVLHKFRLNKVRDTR